MKEELAVMLRQGHGNIVNCASIAGLRGFAEAGAYTASKHGVLGLTKSAAIEDAPRKRRPSEVRLCEVRAGEPAVLERRLVQENGAG